MFITIHYIVSQYKALQDSNPINGRQLTCPIDIYVFQSLTTLKHSPSVSPLDEELPVDFSATFSEISEWFYS